MRTHRLDGTTVLADCAEVPGLGHLPVNAFVIAADQPVLVDTGLPASRAEFLDRLWGVCDPADLRWVWLTHPDRDHTGALQQVLDAAPQTRVVTTFLGMGLLSIEHQVPPDRVFLLNPGQALDVGDRRLRALRPPLYDSPATTGLLDERRARSTRPTASERHCPAPTSRSATTPRTSPRRSSARSRPERLALGLPVVTNNQRPGLRQMREVPARDLRTEQSCACASSTTGEWRCSPTQRSSPGSPARGDCLPPAEPGGPPRNAQEDQQREAAQTPCEGRV